MEIITYDLPLYKIRLNIYGIVSYLMLYTILLKNTPYLISMKRTPGTISIK